MVRTRPVLRARPSLNMSEPPNAAEKLVSTHLLPVTYSGALHAHIGELSGSCRSVEIQLIGSARARLVPIVTSHLRVMLSSTIQSFHSLIGDGAGDVLERRTGVWRGDLVGDWTGDPTEESGVDLIGYSVGSSVWGVPTPPERALPPGISGKSATSDDERSSPGPGKFPQAAALTAGR